MNYPNLEDCKLITSNEYCNLKDPIFIGQTRVNSNNKYFMVWKDNDILYKTENTI